MLDFRQQLINSTLTKVLQRLHYPLEVMLTGVDLFSLPKVTVGKLALAWGWLRKPMIPLVFLLTFQFLFEGAKA